MASPEVDALEHERAERAAFDATLRALRRNGIAGAATAPVVAGMLVEADVRPSLVAVVVTAIAISCGANGLVSHIAMRVSDQDRRRRLRRQLDYQLALTGLLFGAATWLPEHRENVPHAMWFGLLTYMATVLAVNVLIGYGRTRTYLALSVPITVVTAASCIRIGGGIAALIALGSGLIGVVFMLGAHEVGGLFMRSTRLQLRNELLVGELERANRELDQLAATDALTGVANRTGLTRELERRARGRTTTAVLFIDLDGFKQINDRLGHLAGDIVLKTTANRIAGLDRDDDHVARLGGDEFVLLATIQRDQDVEILAGRLADSLAEPIDIDGRAVHVTASIGTALARSGADIEAALTSADAAMYVAKTTQRNTGDQPIGEQLPARSRLGSSPTSRT